NWNVFANRSRTSNELSHHDQFHSAGIRPPAVLDGSAGNSFHYLRSLRDGENHALQATHGEPPQSVAFNFLYNEEAAARRRAWARLLFCRRADIPRDDCAK